MQVTESTFGEDALRIPQDPSPAFHSSCADTQGKRTKTGEAARRTARARG